MATATHPPKQKRTRESLERILRAGTQILASAGWEGFTIGAVAERAGVGSSAIYRRFADKDALLLALHQRFEDDFLASWRPSYRALARADLDLDVLVRGFVGEMGATSATTSASCGSSSSARRSTRGSPTRAIARSPRWRSSSRRRC